MFDWNDLRYLLALARHGSTLAAGRALGVDASTVQRRLGELERRLGQPLARRHPAGYELTPFAAALLPQAEAVEAAVNALADQAGALQREAAGVVRVTCPEPLVTRLAPLLERFRARHPAIKVEFVMSDRYIDLAAGEADVALRSGDTDDGALVGRKIGDSFWAVYASADYVARHGAPRSEAELAQHGLIGFDETMAGHRAATWLQQVAPNGRIVARNRSVLGLVQAAKAGVGVAPLPTALGDAEPGLVRLFGPVPALKRIWRVLAHPQRRALPHVAAFFDFVVDEVEALKPVLSG